jgi:hypothetical protein
MRRPARLQRSPHLATAGGNGPSLGHGGTISPDGYPSQYAVGREYDHLRRQERGGNGIRIATTRLNTICSLRWQTRGSISSMADTIPKSLSSHGMREELEATYGHSSEARCLDPRWSAAICGCNEQIAAPLRPAPGYRKRYSECMEHLRDQRSSMAARGVLASPSEDFWTVECPRVGGLRLLQTLLVYLYIDLPESVAVCGAMQIDTLDHASGCIL